MIAPTRRAFLSLSARAAGLGIAGGLAGCDPHPLYAPGAFGDAPAGAQPVQAQLREVAVALLGNREGQVLREALQPRLYGGEAPSLTRYTLAVSMSVDQSNLGIQPDSSITYARFVATASWSLSDQDDPKQKVLVHQIAQATDSLDAFDNQPFAQDLETTVVDKRLAEAIADQIVTRLAHYFTVSGRALETGSQQG